MNLARPDETIVIDEHLHEPLMTADAVAELLAVPRSSVYEYARRQHNPLPSLSVGRHRRFLRSEVAAWVMTQRAVA